MECCCLKTSRTLSDCNIIQHAQNINDDRGFGVTPLDCNLIALNTLNNRSDIVEPTTLNDDINNNKRNVNIDFSETNEITDGNTSNSYNISNFRISPGIFKKSSSDNILEIDEIALYEDISKSIEPIKDNMDFLNANQFNHIKTIITDICTEYSKHIIHEISSRLHDIDILKKNNQVLENTNRHLQKKINDIEYLYSMTITGNRVTITNTSDTK